MKLVVTGAAGGAGSWAVDHFATDGHEVSASISSAPRDSRTER
ncbi:hypothetical protein [Natrialba taiwanensis]|uniref:NAD-dependent epimerase/dehydratase n=1 Tax=Natrialba taiwanensis DSM 12281 TaxID=1230458 RepID=M0A2X3_9EURY|nr:hypothetical protein [Natrialba taiwanensis]ELY92666.1 hypothetical protein C484_08558 [Natrialba taiwanensis DSM 12281]